MPRPVLLPVFALALCAVSATRAEDAPARLDVSAINAATPTIAGNSSPAQNNLPATPAKPSATRGMFFDALGEQVGFVGALREWRETFRASGAAPRRALWKNKSSALSLGDVRAPDLAGIGSSAGTAFSMGNPSGARFDIGTTARPAPLDAALGKFDVLTTDTSASASGAVPTDRASETWIRAQPVSGSDAQIEATLLRAARDEKVGAGEDWKGATFADVNARLAMPRKWQLRGDWTGGALDGEASRNRWNAAAVGPLSHPWGVADVALDWNATGAGFSTLTSQNATGESTGNARITQKIATPLVSGTLDATASARAVLDASTLSSGAEQKRDSTTASADLQANLAPNLALSATGNASQTQIVRSATDGVGAQSLVGAGGDVGFDWQVARGMTVGGATGQTQTFDSSAPAPLVEDRAALHAKWQRANENYALTLQTRDREGTGAARWAHLAAIRVEGARPLIGDLRVTSNANWMIDRWAASGDPNGVARQMGAGLAWARAASLDLRWRDGGALPSDLGNDPPGAAFGSPTFTSGGREIATRFNIGAAASGGNGLGLALEWARSGALNAPGDTWKIGLTYR